MALIDSYIEDVPAGMVVMPDSVSEELDAMLDAEIAKHPDAAKDRDALRDQIIAFYSKYRYLPDFSLEPRSV